MDRERHGLGSVFLVGAQSALAVDSVHYDVDSSGRTTLHVVSDDFPTSEQTNHITATLSGGVLTATYRDVVASRQIRISSVGGQLIVRIHNIPNGGGNPYDATDTMSQS